jgi:hypothetical protein
MSKLDKMMRFLPGLYNPTRNPNVRGLLTAWADEDDRIVQAVKDAKEQLFVKTARLQYLDALGSNVGVFRPSAVNLADAQYRDLIPALSFYPKQVKPTIQAVLDVFFGVGNPIVSINEVNPNEIVIQIPSSVPSLRRSLKGSQHFHAYSGTITAIDNALKTLTVNLDSTTKALKIDELANASLGQGFISKPILSNPVGNTGVILQFSASTDLSGFSLGHFAVSGVQNYPGSFIPDKTRAFTVTKQRGVLGQAITAGSIYPVLVMTDSSGIPDVPGRLIFDFGLNAQEADIKYFGRPNNTTLLLDPSYNFTKNHSIGSVVNVIVKPYIQPAINGNDYSVYFVGVTAARILAQQIIKSVVAAGVVIRFVVVDPVC